MENTQKKILILGIGNILLKDEGFGVHVVQKMKDMTLPPDVEIMDGGTMGLDLAYYIGGRKKVIVVDVVKAGEPPGTLYRFTDKDLADAKGLLRSAHGFDISDALKTTVFFGNKPEEVIFIGIEPEDISEGLELSPTMEEKIPAIIKLVMHEIGS
jgi:hydrogenase maturation protease